MRSAQRSMCAAMLTLQAITLGLTTPVLISIADVPVGRGLLIGLGLTVACLVVAGLLRRRWAFALGWVLQAASISLFVLVPPMLVLGLIFAALWAGAYVLGARIDRERAERAVLEDQWAAEHATERARDDTAGRRGERAVPPPPEPGPGQPEDGR